MVKSLSFTDVVKSYLSLEFLRSQICLYTPANFVVRPCVRASVRASVRNVTFCFLNILKSHRWIFIKPCKHVNICKTNTLDKKVRDRGQFY